MTTLSKNTLAEALYEDLNLSKANAKLIVEEFFEEIKSSLETGEHVKLSGFGNFILRDKEERPGRNPRTGKVVPVLARRVVTFKPGLKLKMKIDKNNI